MSKAQEIVAEEGTIQLPAIRPRRSPHVIDLRDATPKRPARRRPPAQVAPSTPPVKRAVAAPKQPAKPTARVRPKPTAAQPRRHLNSKQLAVHALKAAIVIAGAVGFLSLGISLPERLIGIYFVAATVYAVDSQRTFLVALIFLIMVAVWSALGNSISAEDYAIYAFYFLVIGLVSAIREMVSGKNEQQEPEPS